MRAASCAPSASRSCRTSWRWPSFRGDLSACSLSAWGLAQAGRNKMLCCVFVNPTKTAEFVEVNFVLVQTGRQLHRNP